MSEVPLYQTWCVRSTKGSSGPPERWTPSHAMRYRGTSLIRNSDPLGTYRRPMPGVLRGVQRSGGGSFGQGIPVLVAQRAFRIGSHLHPTRRRPLLTGPSTSTTQNLKPETRDTKFETRNYREKKTSHKTQNLKLNDTKHKTSNTKHEPPNTKHETTDLKHEIR